MGFFGLFSKKKKSPQSNTASTTSQRGPQHTALTPEQQRLQLLPKPVKLQQNVNDEPEQWIYDSTLQYLTSPLWKVPIYSFIDENCIIFDDEEENKFTYTDVHNKFKDLIEEMLTTLLNELGVTEEQFLIAVNRGLEIPQHKKKLMLKRNKELELEALRELEEQANLAGVQSDEFSNQSVNQDVQKLTLQKEQAEIEEAIARSLAMEQERAKLQDIEEQQLQEIIKKSQQEYEMQEAEKKKLERDKFARMEEEARKQEELRKQKEAEILRQSVNKADLDALNQKKAAENPEMSQKKDMEESKSQGLSNLKDLPPFFGKKPPMGKLDPIGDNNVEESKSKLPELTTSQWKSSLPPIMKKNYDAFSNEELLKEKEQISKKLESINSAPKLEISQESLEERKKRLQAQRELILKKKQQERESELKRYEQEQKMGVSNPQISANNDLLDANASMSQLVDPKEAEKRKLIYSQLKNL